MTQAFIYLLASLSVFLVLTEIVTVNIIYDGDFTLEIGLMIFAVRLTTAKRGVTKSRVKRSVQKRLGKSLLPNLTLIILEKGKISVRSFHFSLPANSPFSSAIKYGIIVSLLSSVLSLQNQKNIFFNPKNITAAYSDNNKIKALIDVRIEIYLIKLIVNLIAFSILSFVDRLILPKEKRMIWQKTK